MAKTRINVSLDQDLAEFAPGKAQFHHHLPVLRDVSEDDDAVVACSDGGETPDKTIKFVLPGPPDDAYGK